VQPAEAGVIEINRTGSDDPLTFRVIVREGATESRHEVTLSRADCNRLTAGRHTSEQCIAGAFRYLLDREPKDAILAAFDVGVISRYFPEFDRELPAYLAEGSGQS